MSELILWKDPENKKIDPELFSTKAENWAKSLGEDRSINKQTQLRRFFDEILRLNTNASVPDADWDVILPYVHMLIAKAVYAQGRRLVSKDFVGLMKSGIKQINNKSDLHVFTQFFESMMGYYKLYGPK